eukprot:5608277-Pleurochrysis_carterae.AAC.1
MGRRRKRTDARTHSVHAHSVECQGMGESVAPLGPPPTRDARAGAEGCTQLAPEVRKSAV